MTKRTYLLYLSCFETTSADKSTSKYFLITQNAVARVLILVQKLLKIVAFGRHDGRMILSSLRKSTLESHGTWSKNSKSNEKYEIRATTTWVSGDMCQDTRVSSRSILPTSTNLPFVYLFSKLNPLARCERAFSRVNEILFDHVFFSLFIKRKSSFCS